jgi:signal transduction histidine kinase
MTVAGAFSWSLRRLWRMAKFCRPGWSGKPPWSDLPIWCWPGPGADSASAAVTSAALSFGNATILERPMRVATIVSSVQSALRARNRQYQIRELLAENEKSEAELRANDKRKDEFLAILAHELRNPMAPISNGPADFESQF